MTSLAVHETGASPATTTEVIEVRALALARTIRLADLLPKLVALGRVVHSGKTYATLQRGEREFFVVHDFGAVVFFGVPESDRGRITDVVLAAGTRDSRREDRGPAVDDFLVTVDPSQRSSAGFDRVVVKDLSPGVVELVAFVVGQSVAMEYYEDDVDRISARIDEVAAEVATTGRFRGKVNVLTKFIGEGMVLRNRVIHTLALLDAPPTTWDDETLDRVYRELRASFAIEDRYRALDHKLSMIRDNLELIVDLVSHKRTFLLEAGVFCLIALEIVLAFFRVH